MTQLAQCSPAEQLAHGLQHPLERGARVDPVLAVGDLVEPARTFPVLSHFTLGYWPETLFLARAVAQSDGPRTVPILHRSPAASHSSALLKLTPSRLSQS